MPKSIDYKKLAEKLQKEIILLKNKLEVNFQKGFEAAHAAMEKMEATYEKHMQKAENMFYKAHIKKTKKTKPKPKAQTKKK